MFDEGGLMEEVITINEVDSFPSITELSAVVLVVESKNLH